MKAVEKKQDAILPAKPTPEELFELCGRFEVMQQRFHKEGTNSKKLVRKADSLMSDIAGIEFRFHVKLEYYTVLIIFFMGLIRVCESFGCQHL